MKKAKLGPQETARAQQFCKQLYQRMKSVNSDEALKEFEVFIRECKDKKLAPKFLMTKIAYLVAQQCSEDEFLAFVLDAQVPTVKLKKADMAVLKGAGGWFDFSWSGYYETTYRNTKPGNGFSEKEVKGEIPTNWLNTESNRQHEASVAKYANTTISYRYVPSLFEWTGSLFGANIDMMSGRRPMND